LEFVGRVDDQVKIRGFRVEPAEVQAVLAGHPDVAEVVVTARDDSPAGVRLVAHITPAAGVVGEMDGGGLGQVVREFAASRLPEYMVPSAVVVMEVLPRLANGKVDRKALPAPTTQTTGREPATPEEELVCRMFAQVLGLERVGPEDNFFALGGHSLLAVSLVERLRERGVVVDVRVLFQEPTPEGLAASVGRDAVVVPQGRVPVGASVLTPEMVPLAELTEAELGRRMWRMFIRWRRCSRASSSTI
jgi:aryl carrier-like protein